MNRVDTELVAQAFAGAVANTGFKRATCPLCLDRTGKADHRVSMRMNTASGWFKCFKCHALGRLDDFAGDYVPPLPGEAKVDRPGVDPPEGFTPLWIGAGCTAQATLAAREYLARRGVTPDAISACKIGTCLSGYCQGRVVVPHGYSAQGLWMGWIARDYVGGKQLRYLYPKGLDRTAIWREAELDVVTTAPVLLCEGVFDALPHYPHATAFLGKPIKAHVERLARHRGRPLAVCLDGDAWEEGAMLAQRLRHLEGVPAVTAVRLPPGTDPGEMPTSWLLRVARDALSDASRRNGEMFAGLKP